MQSRKKRPYIAILLFFVFIYIPVVYAFERSRSPSGTYLSPVPTDAVSLSPTAAKGSAHSAKPVDATALERTIKARAEETWSNYSVLVVDMNGTFRISIGESVIYTAASVNKIPFLAALYAQKTAGNVDFDDTITLQARDIQDYGTGSIRYDSPGTVYSIKTLARLMIEKSDNTAAYIIANLILKQSQIQTYVESLGMIQTDILTNKTSNGDIFMVFSSIYNGKVANAADTKEMMSYFYKTDFEDRLPALLPDEAKTYHKIGTEVGIIHDVGIVEHNNGAYYIGIFSDDVTNETAAIEAIAQISKLVWDAVVAK